MMTNTGRRRLNIALLAVAIISSVSGTPHNVNNKQNFNSNNSALTKALLQRARPYRPKNNAINDIKADTTTQHKQRQPKHRRLDGNLEITSSHTLKFSQCIDLQLLDKDLFDENVIDYTKNGQIMSTKSFALFHVCDNVSRLCFLYVGGVCCVYCSQLVFLVHILCLCCNCLTYYIPLYIAIPLLRLKLCTVYRATIMETTVPIMNQKMIYIWLI